MPDRNELIASLEGRIWGGEMHKGGYIHVPQEEAEAILELLKGRELVKPVFVGNDEWQCPECGAVVGWTKLDCGGITETRYEYCPECVRRIAWG